VSFSTKDRKSTSLAGIAQQPTVTMLGAEQVLDKFQRDGAEVHIGLNQGVVNGLPGVGFQKLAFKLKIADRHDQIPFEAFQQGGDCDRN